MKLIQPCDLTFPQMSGATEKIRAQMKKSRSIDHSNLQSLPMQIPIDWSANRCSDNNWQFRLHAWYMLRPHITLYSRTKNVSYLLKMLPIIVDWAQYHEKSEESYSWRDMTAGRRAEILALLISAAVNNQCPIPKTTVKVLLGLRNLHAEFLSDKNKLAKNNHGYIQLHGLMALVHAVSDDFSVSYVDYILCSITNLLTNNFTPEGIHKEHSPGYHFIVTNWIRIMLKTGWYDGVAEALNIVDKAERASDHLTTADGRIVSVGDTNYSTRSTQKLSHDFISLRALDSGFVSIKGGSSFLFVSGSYHSTAHKHADDLSVVWQEDHDILIDPGKFTYNSGRWRSYFRSARAHNTIEVDGSSELPPQTYGSAIEVAEKFGSVFAVRGRVIPTIGVRHCRNIIYLPSYWLLIVDHLRSEDDHVYRQWFHFAPNSKVTKSHISIDERILKITHSSTESTKFFTATGTEKPRIVGWFSDAYNKKQPSPQACFTAKGRNVVMVTAFSFAEAPEFRILEGKAVYIAGVGILGG
jgi:hypothetical protein